MEKPIRFKMYKSGKIWVLSGVTLITMNIAMPSIGLVNADSNSSVSSNTASVSQSSDNSTTSSSSTQKNQAVNNLNTNITTSTKSLSSIESLMPDATLRQAFADELNKNVTDLTPDDIANVTSLTITSGDITSLKGLELATNLENLSIVGSNKSGTNDVENLNYYADNTGYQDVSGSANISAVLSSHSSADNLSVINKLSQLKSLQLTGLGISDVSTLVNAPKKLQYVYLNKNNINDVSTLSGIQLNNLKTLDLAANNIQDISVIKQVSVPALTTLDASFNNISDISAIAESSITTLTNLFADNNNISNVDAFKNSSFTGLKWLSVQNNAISNIDIMNGLYTRYPDLHVFRIAGNSINDISFMDGFDLYSSTDASEQNYSNVVKLIKPSSSQSQSFDVALPIKTSDFQYSNGFYHGNTDSEGNSLSIYQVSNSAQSVKYYNGNEASVSDLNNGNANNSGIKSFTVSASKDSLPSQISYQWNGAQGQFNGTGTINIEWVDAVSPVIVADNSTVPLGSRFDPTENVSAYDQQNDGTTKTNLTEKIKVIKNNVNTNKPGTYTVEYSVTNAFGLTTTKTITVTVDDSKATIDAKDSTLTAGPNTKWSAKDNFISATNHNGNPVDFKDIKVVGSVNTMKAGKYQVTYSLTDSSGNLVSKTITVNVITTSNNNDSDTQGDGNKTSQGSRDSVSNNYDKTVQNQGAVQKTITPVLPKTGVDMIDFAGILIAMGGLLSGGLLLKNRRNKN